MVAVASATAKVLERLIGLVDPAMVFLTGVLFSAVFGGLAPSLLASFVSFFVYNLFFVDPLYTFTVANPQDLVAMSVFLIVAILTSHLTARAKYQADAARKREERTAALYAFTREVAGASRVDELFAIVTSHVARLFGADAVVLAREGDRLSLRASTPEGIRLSERDLEGALWVDHHQQSAGPGTGHFSGGIWLYIPLITVRGLVGILGLRASAPAAGRPLDQRQLLETVARQAAVAIDRSRIDVALEEKAKTEQVMEAIEDGLIVLDHRGVVDHVNEVACAILDVDRAAVLGARFEDLAATHSHYLRLREAVRDFQAHPERERDCVEIRLFLRGRDHRYMLRPIPFRIRDGSPAGLILTLQDVTFLRDQEARRETLVATLSHELGTPLTSLKMAVELLKQQIPVGDGLELIETAHEDVLRLQDVAQRFLDLARSQATVIALDRRPVDLRAATSRVLRLFALQARGKSVALELESDTTEVVTGDETKLTWALSNLIANAIRYTPTGGRVTVGLESRGSAVLVSVTDTGPGIPPEQQERIFEPFAQSSGTGEQGSAGLGL
ncbi:MAG: DUF4118 domain-containing protein, partial [Candidatus Binatia bacterium]